MAEARSSRAIANLAYRISASAIAGGAPRIVALIDGHSGAGKSTLAAELAEILGADQVALEDFYPGWGGLEVGSAMVRGVLDPANPGYRRWDWERNEPSSWDPVSRTRHLVIEGSGCLSRSNRERATFGIWVRLDPVERKRRAIARDGTAYEEHWDRWAAQEEAFFLRERPDLLADVIVDARVDEVIYREVGAH